MLLKVLLCDMWIAQGTSALNLIFLYVLHCYFLLFFTVMFQISFTPPEHGVTVGFSDSFVFLMNRSLMFSGLYYWTTMVVSLAQWCQVLSALCCKFVASCLLFLTSDFYLYFKHQSSSNANAKLFEFTCHHVMLIWDLVKTVWTLLSHSLLCLCC